MRVALTLVDPRRDVHSDILVEADDGTPTRGLLGQLIDVVTRGEGTTGTGPGRTLYLRGAPLDPALPVSECGIKEGSLIAVGDPEASVPSDPEGRLEVLVVTGPGAGAVHRLTVGDASIGSGAGCVITLRDERVPPVCLVMTVRADDSVSVRAVEGAAEVLAASVPYVEPVLALERVPIAADEDLLWPVGAQTTVGEIRLELAEVSVPDAAIEDSAEPGWRDFNRPPRLLPPGGTTQFALPGSPGDQPSRALPWLMVVTPVLLAVLMAAIFRQVAMLAMAVFAPVMLLGNHLQSRKQGRLTHRRQLADHRDRVRGIETDVARALLVERHARRMEAPDPSLVMLIADGPRMRLWERRTTDPDYLSVRLGVGDLPSRVTLSDPEQPEHRRTIRRTSHDVPVTVALAEHGVIGIAAAGDTPRRLATWAVAQLAVLQSPRDTQVYVLTDPAGAPDWDWLRWVPHARPHLGQDTVVTIGIDTETCARRIAELSRVLSARKQAASETNGSGPGGVGGPDIVLVLDGARRLRSLPGVVALLQQGPAARIYSIGLDSEERTLPEEASAVVLQTASGLVLRQHKVTLVEHITADLVEGPWFHRVARALAPIRDISAGDSGSVLPSTSRLTDVMGLEPVTPATILDRWAVRQRSTAAVVGVSLDGPFAIDLARDGPHGLVAGTTGAGKSELLQSMVASLAVANRPDGMTFVLVDYKGGAAFKDCAHLPHTVGMVTDLDTHLVERALVSLRAELTRRERLLVRAGAKDIEDYVDMAAKRPMVDLPRLLIVIDEFAALARELPDFVTGLVDVAQRGRSLGIHLILATQRPGGVVSAEIRANTNLRIALRVTDTAESNDVIDAPESGLIAKSTPGRAYVRLGARSLVPFQTGRVGGRRPGAATAASPWLARIGLEELAQPIPTRPRHVQVDDAEVTDLTVLVESVVAAAATLGLPRQHSPWLPALGTGVQLPDLLTGLTVAPPPRITAAPYAVEDLPARQCRGRALIDLETFSHLSILGGPRSGRSQALRTIAGSVARVTSPADVHIYGLDCGNGALLPMQSLPHCGAVVQRTQPDRAARLLERLICELVGRQEILAAGGYADLTELRDRAEPGRRLPHVLFLLDRWEGFMGSLAEADGGRPLEQVQTMLREGASVGLHLVLTGDRQVVSSRMAALVEDKIALRVPDKADYGLVGLFPKRLPDSVPEGRGFRSGSAVELQFALLSRDASGRAQGAELRRIGEQETERHRDLPRRLRPFRVDALPSRVGFEEAWALRPETARGPLWALVGVGGDELRAVGLDLAHIGCAIIAGPPRSGRSSVLRCAIESLRRGGVEIVVAAPRPSPLRDLVGRDGVRHVFTGTDITREALEPLLCPRGGPVVLVVDDGELLKDVPAKDYLRWLVRTGADRGQAILLGGDSGELGTGFSGWQVDARGRQGVLIAPQSVTEGELIGTRVPRSALQARGQAGRALVNVGDGSLQVVRVPIHS